jgi:hypothetical protein
MNPGGAHLSLVDVMLEVHWCLVCFVSTREVVHREGGDWGIRNDWLRNNWLG